MQSITSIRRKACLLSLSSILALSLLSPAQAAIEDALKPFPSETTGVLSIDIRPVTWMPLFAGNEAEIKNSDFYEAFEELGKELGLNFEQDVLPHLGTHLAIGYGYGADASLPLPLFALHISSETGMRKVLDNFVAKAKAKGAKVYPAVLKGRPVTKLVVDKESSLFLALTPTALIGSIESKPEMLGRALATFQGQSGLLARPDFSSHKADASEDAVWFYGKTPRLFADALSFDQGQDRLVMVNAFQKLFNLFDDLSAGLRFSNEGLLFHSRNLYTHEGHSPGQKAYLEAMSTPSGQSLDPLLATVPARSYGVMASDRLSGFFSSPLSDAKLPGIEAARKTWDQFQPASLIRDLSGWKPEQYLSRLDGRYSIAMLPSQKDADIVVTLGVKPGEERALAKMMSELRLDLDKLMTLRTSPEDRLSGLSNETERNLRALQTSVETYAVDHGGIYPSGLSSLEKEARRAGYWKALSNPLGTPYAFGDFRKLRAAGPELAGQVFYEPLQIGKQGAAGYRVYAYSPDGRLLVLANDEYEPKTQRADLPKVTPEPLPRLGFKPSPEQPVAGIEQYQLELSPAWKRIVGSHELLPSYAISENLLILASSPQALNKALASQRKSEPSLLDDASWQQRSQRHLSKDSAYLVYVNLDQVRSELKPGEGDESFAALLEPIHYFFGNGRYRYDGDDAKAMLNIEMPKLIKALQSGPIGEASAHASESSVKANMHTLQTLVETYAVDWGGVYPPDLEALREEAEHSSAPYWRELSNPYTKLQGIGYRGALLDFGDYQPGPDFKGLALYKPTVPANGDPIVHYEILGADEQGELIKDRDGSSNFLLTNS